MTAAAVPALSLHTAAPICTFDEVIVPLRPMLLRAARSMTRNASEANDLVQDTLERALKTFNRFEPGTNARAWTMAILSRLYIDKWRKRRRQPRFVDVDCTDLPAAPVDPMPDAPPPWLAFSFDDVRQAAAVMPPPLRRIFELSAFTRLSYGEISAVTGIPSSTVGTRLLRARRRMRVLLTTGERASDAAEPVVSAAVVSMAATTARSTPTAPSVSTVSSSSPTFPEPALPPARRRPRSLRTSVGGDGGAMSAVRA